MPLKKEKPLTFHRAETDSAIRIPFMAEGIAAGFPSPAADFMEKVIDLNKELSRNPLSTFYVRVKGNSMTGAGIDDRDVLVVDRSIAPEDNKIAICLVDGEFTVKRLRVKKDAIYLMPENPDFKPLKITEENNFTVWGIVTYVIKSV